MIVKIMTRRPVNMKELGGATDGMPIGIGARRPENIVDHNERQRLPVMLETQQDRLSRVLIGVCLGLTHGSIT
jgi:hypothetical protein